MRTVGLTAEFGESNFGSVQQLENYLQFVDFGGMCNVVTRPY